MRYIVTMAQYRDIYDNIIGPNEYDIRTNPTYGNINAARKASRKSYCSITPAYIYALTDRNAKIVGATTMKWCEECKKSYYAYYPFDILQKRWFAKGDGRLIKADGSLGRRV